MACNISLLGMANEFHTITSAAVVYRGEFTKMTVKFLGDLIAEFFKALAFVVLV